MHFDPDIACLVKRTSCERHVTVTVLWHRCVRPPCRFRETLMAVSIINLKRLQRYIIYRDGVYECIN